MKIFRITLLAMAAVFLSAWLSPAEETAKEVIQKADQKIRGNSNKAEVSMEIIRPEWSRAMTMRTWSLGRQYSMVLILSPAKDKGTVSLKRKNELWNWMPSIERNIKISPSMMMQSWMGSDFTNDDLLKESSIVEDYEHSFEGSETIDGFDCHIIQLMPKPDAAVVWGKIKAWISKKEYHQLKVEYYDEDGYLVNTMRCSEVKKMDDREIPTRWEMVPAEKDGHKTVMIYNKMDFEVGIKESFFSIQNMKRVR